MEEKEFWVDFSGYLKVKAKTPEEAEIKFWKYFVDQISAHGDISDDVWDIDGIEEVEKDGFPPDFDEMATNGFRG